jgi:hypothetical protein
MFLHDGFEAGLNEFSHAATFYARGRQIWDSPSKAS